MNYKKLPIFFVCAVLLFAGCTQLREAYVNTTAETLAESVDLFVFRIGGFGVSNTYSVNKESLTLAIDLQETEYPRTITESWTKEKWDAFISDVAACGVEEWKRKYNEPNILDGTQWGLLITGENITIDVSGSNAYPDTFDDLLSVLSEYFGVEVR